MLLTRSAGRGLSHHLPGFANFAFRLSLCNDFHFNGVIRLNFLNNLAANNLFRGNRRGQPRQQRTGQPDQSRIGPKRRRLLNRYPVPVLLPAPHLRLIPPPRTPQLRNRNIVRHRTIHNLPAFVEPHLRPSLQRILIPAPPIIRGPQPIQHRPQRPDPRLTRLHQPNLHHIVKKRLQLALVHPSKRFPRQSAPYPHAPVIRPNPPNRNCLPHKTAQKPYSALSASFAHRPLPRTQKTQAARLLANPWAFWRRGKC